MKKIVLLLISAMLAVPLMTSAAEIRTDAGKNVCILNSENCDLSAQNDSIQEREAKLQKELNKGTAVYTFAELKKLQSKLDGYRSLFTSMMAN
jgi:hypothetical protein